MRKFVVSVMVAMFMLPTAAVAQTVNVDARLATSRCADNGDTVVPVVLVNKTNKPRTFTWAGQSQSKSGGPDYFYWSEVVEPNSRVRMPVRLVPGSRFRINVWRGNGTRGDLLLDARRSALFCQSY